MDEGTEAEADRSMLKAMFSVRRKGRGRYDILNGSLFSVWHHVPQPITFLPCDKPFPIMPTIFRFKPIRALLELHFKLVKASIY